MNKTKETFALGFGIFAAFFGAGNLILPPLLGFNSGPDWWLVAIGFIASATIIPLFALLAHARLQGTMLDFGNKASPFFSLIFCLCVYVIAITLPCPRTAAVTHEIAIAPFFGTSSLLTSTIYFLLVFVFVMNRNNVLQILGKYLTPLIAIILFAIISIGIFSADQELRPSTFDIPMLSGFFEGYQTYDAIAGLLTGGIVVISLNLKGYTSFKEKKGIIARSGLIAMMGLFIIYAGLIALGAFYNSQFAEEISRTELLNGLSVKTLGRIGSTFLSVLVALACFTTAVGIIVGTADFFKGLFKESKKAYLITAILSCAIGILIGQLNVKYIIDVALPALMFIYPLTIVLIFLNVIPVRLASQTVFRAVLLVTFIFSIPDFLGFLLPEGYLENIVANIPLAKHNLGWVLPALLSFILANVLVKRSTSASG
ncbi:MAG: branched-chain amino acid transport system II carrier protein [Flavobacteriaceae bacterium]|nr:branched-chain amino acid transport system II carrier protein [Bacteroidia bacterium]MBT8287722.1 branched-chain amino acid transport system II carrier protein [Bacteroidia bacterium]NNF73921.1 branched-chain amino acid transport system II carrier protein [Flavobacteriaceae bacterium]NNK71853.1 branched-chain amino acid transport system II carrier protein [Flavobacteriaceae bacterium]